MRPSKEVKLSMKFWLTEKINETLSAGFAKEHPYRL
jgi:hypothetical protein